MKSFAFLVLFTFTFYACDPADVQKTMELLTTSELTKGEAGAGLKEALTMGITHGSSILSAKDGYFKSKYKIHLPPEAQKVTAKLQNMPGLKNIENVILEKINRGAEDAAKKAKPIFVSAIKQMTFKDALDILMGGNDAATKYLKKATYNQLYKEFNPVIIKSLDKFQARKYWGNAVNTYNKIPLVTKVNSDLDDYVTKQALAGLFTMVQKEEYSIRKDKTKRVTDLLKKVFAKQDNK